MIVEFGETLPRNLVHHFRMVNKIKFRICRKLKHGHLFFLQDDTNEKEKDSKDSKDKKKEKKEKKEKKPKEEKPKKEKGPSCIDTLSTGLNLASRDDKAINTEIDVSLFLSLNKQRRKFMIINVTFDIHLGYYFYDDIVLFWLSPFGSGMPLPGRDIMGKNWSAWS